MQVKNSLVSHKEDGQSFWQPKKTFGYITIKASPWNLPGIPHTVFFQRIPPGGQVGLHSHDVDEETFIIVSGEALMTLDNEEHHCLPESVIHVGKNTTHSIKSVGKTDLCLFVVVTPSGLEERLKLMGKPRIAGEPEPAPFDSLAPPESHGVRRKG